MPDEITRVHQANGRIILSAIHRGRDAVGLEEITAMQWRDESGQRGQDSHVRLALHIERGGDLFVEVGHELVHVEVEPDGRFLRTCGAPDHRRDPILLLPEY